MRPDRAAYFLAAVLLGLGAAARAAEGYALKTLTVEPAPAVLTGGTYQMTAVLGAPEALRAASGAYTLEAVADGLFAAHSPTLPTLSIRLAADGGFSISWHDAGDRFELQSSAALPAASWSRVETLSRANDLVTASFPAASGGARFFRLVGH